MRKDLEHNGIKERLLRVMALFMGIFYLLGPLNQQLYQVLHSVSHSLAPPTQLIGHSKTESSAKRIHNFHEYRTHEAVHEHEVIEFVTTFLDASQNPNQNTEPLVPKYSIDKHITTFRYALKPPGLYTTKKVFHTKVSAVHKGYLSLWAEPPIS